METMENIEIENIDSAEVEPEEAICLDEENSGAGLILGAIGIAGAAAVGVGIKKFLDRKKHDEGENEVPGVIETLKKNHQDRKLIKAQNKAAKMGYILVPEGSVENSEEE